MSPFKNAMTDADLFWAKVDRTGDCWIWQGAKDGHGYGRVMIGQESLKAHRLAWFMVMGEWPKHGLYHIDPRGTARSFSRTYPGAPSVRGCVRPHHFRDGPPESAASRWSRRAVTGFPPEFRSAIPDLLSTEQAETDLRPVLLYRGNLTAGRAQAMFNFTLAAQAAEAERLGDVVALSRAWPDVSHAVGLHKPVTATASVGHFWDRLVANPKTLDLRPGLRDYVRGVLSKSDWRPIRLDPIPEYSPWSTRRWRSGRRSMAEIKEAAAAKRASRDHARAELLPEVWPFLPSESPSHDLVTMVDAVVPKSLPEAIRQDVCQDLILAVLEGEIEPTRLASEVDAHVKGVFRQYPGKYGPISLNAPAPWSDDGRTLEDTLADAPIILGGSFGSLADLRDRLLAEEQAA